MAAGNKLNEKVVEIYRTVKHARDERRLTDQEFVLIAANLKQIERLFREEYERSLKGGE